MLKELSIAVSPGDAQNPLLIKQLVADELGIQVSEVTHVAILKRSIDARSRNIKVHLRVNAYIDEPFLSKDARKPLYKDVSKSRHVLIVGSGPAGLFAALRLIELGIKPIVLERGKDVQKRRRDVAAISKFHRVNSDSNYCFGEGGAGTYSDGKLYTRSTKRGDVENILSTFVFHGASEDIRVDAHPHIGTNKLPGVIVNMRNTILQHGGEIHFDTRVSDILIKNERVEGVRTENSSPQRDEKEFMCNKIILATGHSARDIFELLYRKKIQIEAKPFALGVRAEHSQAYVDSVQYHCAQNEVDKLRKHLPASSYSLVHQAKGRGVYSFCMCPGGIIAPCATSPGEIVTNGWSPSRRNNPYANSGIVVAVELDDVKEYKKYGPLSVLKFQEEIEKKAWVAGGKTQAAPAQRVSDFIQGKLSSSLPSCSYPPGITSAPLHEIFPAFISSRLQEGFREFGKKMKGYLTEEAVLVAPESRTSSPVKIPRDKDTLEHPQVKGLYPCGEGAGYAGGIVSAAIDGIKCAEKCLVNL